jgi:hypothetical protein
MQIFIYFLGKNFLDNFYGIQQQEKVQYKKLKYKHYLEFIFSSPFFYNSYKGIFTFPLFSSLNNSSIFLQNFQYPIRFKIIAF